MAVDNLKDYAPAWRDLRNRKLILIGLLFGYIPGVLILFFAIGLPVSALTGIHPDYFFYAFAGAWMMAFMIAGRRVGYFPCPRCGKWFFAKWWYRNPFARKCVHCGLIKGRGNKVCNSPIKG